jgi:ABC-type antimicrobial peptide transport system permease subunit
METSGARIYLARPFASFPTMVYNYFRTALRNLSNHKAYAFISIFGLGLGMAAAISIFLVIRFETSFDSFHPNHDRIYRVVSVLQFPEGTKYAGDVPYALPEGLRMDYPQLKKVAALVGEYNVTMQADQTRFSEKEGVFWAEPAFLQLFHFPLLAGSPEVLSRPNTLLLTQESAEKYFGDWHKAMGQPMKAWTGAVFKVAGILRNPPANTDFPIKMLLSYKTLQGAGFMNEWVAMRGGSYCFIQLPDNESPAQFNKQLSEFVRRHKPAQWQFAGHALQPLSEMHFDGWFGNYTGRIFPKPLIKGLRIIAAFLLLIACINFINFSTARAIIRSREIGIRKVLGGSRRQLIAQFLGETSVITLLAAGLAIVLSLLIIPFLNRLMDLQLGFQVLADAGVYVFLLILCPGVTLLAGLYPALVLSGFHPVTALKMKINARMAGGSRLRKGLVVFQFVFAQVLIITVLVVTRQIDFFRNAPLGFDTENILSVPIPEDSLNSTKMDVLRTQLSSQAGVQNVSFCMANPAEPGWQKIPFRWDQSPKNSDFDANVKWAEASWFATYKLSFVAGGPYTPSDTTNGVVVNENLLRRLKITDFPTAIGRMIRIGNGNSAPVVGVVKDFNTTSLRNPIDPVIIAANKREYRMVAIRIQTTAIQPLLGHIRQIWQQTYPDGVFESDFLDERIASFYSREEQFGKLFRLFTAIAIFISCLGLYALAAFMTAQRRQETAVRKVLGASVGHIVYRYTRELTLLIVIAFIIAAPVSSFLMRRWLDNFAYRIDLGAGIFIWGLLAAVGITWLTTGTKVVAGARANPVENLRD